MSDRGLIVRFLNATCPVCGCSFHVDVVVLVLVSTDLDTDDVETFAVVTCPRCGIDIFLHVHHWKGIIHENELKRRDITQWINSTSSNT